MTYRDFIKKNLKLYIRAGMHPVDAMKAVAKDWRRWKKGIGNPKRPRTPISPQLEEVIRAEEEKEIKRWLDKIRGARDYVERVNAMVELVRQSKAGNSFDTLREVIKRGHLTEELQIAMVRLKRSRNPLYESFHGVLPNRKVKVYYEPPPKGKPLVKVGRISQINYIPEFPSEKRGQEFWHKSGDIGGEILKSNLILATDKDGKNLYLLRDKKSKFPYFSPRGLIG